jgi:hypothetical protein
MVLSNICETTWYCMIFKKTWWYCVIFVKPGNTTQYSTFIRKGCARPTPRQFTHKHTLSSNHTPQSSATQGKAKLKETVCKEWPHCLSVPTMRGLAASLDMAAIGACEPEQGRSCSKGAECQLAGSHPVQCPGKCPDGSPCPVVVHHGCNADVRHLLKCMQVSHYLALYFDGLCPLCTRWGGVCSSCICCQVFGGIC